ncbi:MAG: heparin lyase I family protein [Pseudomonadota bacterium]
MRASFAFGLLALLFLAGCMSGTGRLDTFRSLSDTPHGFQLVASPVRAGERAQRFEVRPGDCGRDAGWSDCETDRERSELTVRQDILPGTDRWVAYSIYLPEDFYSSPRVTTSLGQIHQRGGPTGTAGGFASFPPLLQIDARGNRVAACLHILSGSIDNITDRCRDFPLTTVSAMRGRWTDVMIHLDARGSGVLEIYLNGQRRAQSTGFIRFQPKEYYVKYGVYRSFVSRHGGPMPGQVAFYDEVRIGPDRASVEVSAERFVD